MADWFGFPADWQSAHVLSKKAGDAEVLVIDTRYNNQLQNHTIENRKGFQARITDIVVIGHIAITRQAARDLFMDGRFRDPATGRQRMTLEEIEALPTLHL
jgi:hypothetical protein